MTAEELLVERYLELEKKVEGLEKVVECNEEFIEQERDEISEYENLVSVLKKHLKKNEYGITIEFKNYIKEDKDDLDFLYDFFELGEEKKDEQ